MTINNDPTIDDDDEDDDDEEGDFVNYDDYDYECDFNCECYNCLEDQ